MLGTQRALLTEEQAEALYRMYGLDKPFILQYLGWLKSVLQGSMGYSFRSGQPVLKEIIARLPITLQLTIMATLLGIVVGLMCGAYAAVKREQFSDFLVRLVGLVGLSLPKFWLGILLILILSVCFKWIPPMGKVVNFTENPIANLAQLGFPALTLGLGLAAEVMRISRSALLEVLGQDFILTARSKGLAEHVVLLRHALRNALIPVITFVGMQVGYLLGGAVVVEAVFSLPGIGRLLVNAVYQRDYPLVQGCVLFTTFMFVMTNLVVDIIYAIVDPRIRYD